ncbi:DUF6356 family protein [Shimia ponticola]|uniref:DUF6356 family protein n=1 Tax=Shimia ponticola TaxID=2582893 RepID=UPI0011BE077C|nr:DUF6356 family protein [Shimia ponticola]
MQTTSRNTASRVGWFTAHPASVGESYWEHARFAFRFSTRLLVAAGAAAVHAVFPWLCESTASRAVRAMAVELEARHRTH